jgi:hypothetical protein
VRSATVPTFSNDAGIRRASTRMRLVLPVTAHAHHSRWSARTPGWSAKSDGVPVGGVVGVAVDVASWLRTA